MFWPSCVAARPAASPNLDEGFMVSSRAQLEGLESGAMLRNMLQAWPNALLEDESKKPKRDD